MLEHPCTDTFHPLRLEVSSAEESHVTRPAFGGAVKLHERGQSAGKSAEGGPLNDYTPDPDPRKSRE